MSDESKSELKVTAQSGTKSRMNIALRGPGGVVILVTWLIAVVLVCLFAPDGARSVGMTMLALFLGGYIHIARQMD